MGRGSLTKVVRATGRPLLLSELLSLYLGILFECKAFTTPLLGINRCTIFFCLPSFKCVLERNGTWYDYFEILLAKTWKLAVLEHSLVFSSSLNNEYVIDSIQNLQKSYFFSSETSISKISWIRTHSPWQKSSQMRCVAGPARPSHLGHAFTASLVQILARFCDRDAMKPRTELAYFFNKTVPCWSAADKD